MKLQPKQEAFAVNVVQNGGNKVKARADAGYSTKMTKASQGIDADKLYNHARISLRIAELQSIKDKVALKEFQIDSEYVLRRLKQIDDLDILDIMEDDLSAFKKLSEWPKVWRTSISGVDIKRIVDGDDAFAVEKIKWPDKVKNLDMLGRHVSVKAWDKDQDEKAESVIQKVQIEIIGAD